MRLTITLSPEDLELIREFVRSTAGAEFNSHGSLDVNRLAQLLLEDVALAVRRPGSWEGANMQTVLEAHGYKI